MRLYVAGPMTGLAEFNFPAFNAAAGRLRGLGYDVVSPAENFDGDTTRPWAEYVRHDLKALLDCDAALEGFRFLGIERDPDYMRIAQARISHWASEPVDAA